MYLSKIIANVLLVSGSAWVGHAQSIDLDLDDVGSIKAAAAHIAANMMKSYIGDQPGQTPGLLPKPPYYWWESGAMFGQLIHYWNLTGDEQYNARVKEALLFQIGAGENYMPSNQSDDLGNDDQVFWAFSAMDAAEYDFSNPDPSQYPSWLALAQAVFNTQVPRWETSTCNGGLRWQIYPFNAGYTYKNTISTGGLFQLSARLARYTGNHTYADWADKTWDWLWRSPIMNGSYTVYDGTYMTNNCTTASPDIWTYNVGTMMMGAAFMYDYTDQSAVWQERVSGLINGSDVFFVKNAGDNNPAKQAPAGGLIMAEVACEFPQPQTCNQDMPSFKAYLSRWMAITAQLAPFTRETIVPRLRGSAMAAANQCAGQGTKMCGRRWYQNEWDGFFGVGEQMSALSVIQNNLVPNLTGTDGQNSSTVRPGAELPLTSNGGGTSKGNPSAGTGSSDDSFILDGSFTRPITAGDKVGASIATIASCLFAVVGVAFMILDEPKKEEPPKSEPTKEKPMKEK